MASGKEQRMIFDRLSVSGGLCRAMRGKTFALLFTAALTSHTLCASAVWAGGDVEPENTCESCHRDSDFLVTNRKLYELLEGFRESKHFEHVEKKEGEEQGPTCVTCHGSINSEVLSVNSVEAACARCHNEETDNHPDIPEKARAILNRFMSINSFYRYITIRDEPEDAKEFFQAIDPRIQRLAVTWHGFDLKEIDAETREVLATLKAKRREIRSRPKKSKNGQAN
jgi:hypothetical protein